MFELYKVFYGMVMNCLVESLFLEMFGEWQSVIQGRMLSKWGRMLDLKNDLFEARVLHGFNDGIRS